MDGQCRTERSPLEIRREFAGGRLELEVLARTFELVVPVIRKTLSTETPTKTETGVNGWNRSGHIAQGA